MKFQKLEVVARDGIEPSTRGFSIQPRPSFGASKPKTGNEFSRGRPSRPTQPSPYRAQLTERRTERALRGKRVKEIERFGPNLVRAKCQARQLVVRGATRYTRSVIRLFRHKGVERFFRTGTKAGIQAAHAPRLTRQLAALNVARQPSDMNVPGWGLHPLKGKLSNHWSVSVSGNWRLTFTFIDGDAEFVDYQDYH